MKKYLLVLIFISFSLNAYSSSIFVGSGIRVETGANFYDVRGNLITSDPLNSGFVDTISFDIVDTSHYNNEKNGSSYHYPSTLGEAFLMGGGGDVRNGCNERTIDCANQIFSVVKDQTNLSYTTDSVETFTLGVTASQDMFFEIKTTTIETDTHLVTDHPEWYNNAESSSVSPSGDQFDGQNFISGDQFFHSTDKTTTLDDRIFITQGEFTTFSFKVEQDRKGLDNIDFSDQFHDDFVDWYIADGKPTRDDVENILGTPIPSSIWLFGTGLIALVGLRKKS